MVSANFASAGEHLPNMSQLARAFTTIGKRSKKVDDASIILSSSTHIGRAASQRNGRPVLLTKISAPVALMSTSNMQVHNAKHISGTNLIEIHHVGNGPVPTSSSSAASSHSSNDSVSGDESDNMTVLSNPDGGAYTDASSVDLDSPLRSEPEPNHLSCYFKPSVDTTTHYRSRSSTASLTGAAVSPALSSSSDAESSSSSENTPRLPQRIPSHSKRAHERLHRTRSLQRMIAPSSTPTSPRRSLGRSASARSSISTHKTPSFVEAPRESEPTALGAPFGSELAQLDEVAEEFGMVVQKAEADAETAWLAKKGFAVLGAEVYCAEIAALVQETFGGGFDQREGWF